MTLVSRNRLKGVPRITPTEWEIMCIIWATQSATAAEIIEQLSAADPGWHPKTVRTLLARLVRKRALGFRKEGRGFLYRALVPRDMCLEAESESFLDRLFGGSLQPMVAHFVERNKLSREEIVELRKMLERHEQPKTTTLKRR